MLSSEGYDHAILTPTEEHELASRSILGDSQARSRLITHNLRLALWRARRFRGCGGVDLDDLVSTATVALCRAARTYSPHFGLRFASYAALAIDRALAEAVDESGLIRVPARVAQAEWRAKRDAEAASLRGLDANPTSAGSRPSVWSLGRSRDDDGGRLDFEPMDKGLRPADRLHATESARVVADALAETPAASRDVLTRRFGLDGQGVRSLDEVRAELGLPREAVVRIERDTIARLGSVRSLRREAFR